MMGGGVADRIAAGSDGSDPLVRPPFHRDGWIYEEKYDGWRIVAYNDEPVSSS